MKGKIRFLGLVPILCLLVAVLFGSVLSWAQKKAKPQPPPAPSANPVIAYSQGQGSEGRLMVMNADGSNQRVVTKEKYVDYWYPDWSPEGKQLVFLKNIGRRQPLGIFTVNIDGTGLIKLRDLNDGGWADHTQVRWSPRPMADGSYKIAFTDRAKLPDGTLRHDFDLFIVSLDGSGLVRLTDTPGIDEGFSDIAWSPSGEFLAVAVYDDIIVYQITYGAGGFAAASLGSVVHVPGSPLENAGNAFTFDWAKTQDKLVVSACPTGDNIPDFWLIDVFMPMNVVRLTDTPSLWEGRPSWAPDDSKFLCIIGPESGLWVMNADGSGSRLIGYGFTTPRWRHNP
jgi:Tol biopolymer transport system component